MATKRDLKKSVRNTCGALAAEIILASAAFGQIARKDVHDIINDIARLQAETIAKVGITFDKTPRDFADGAAYRKARRTYFHTAFGKLLEGFDTSVVEIVKKMNAALPAEVRDEIKAAAAE